MRIPRFAKLLVSFLIGVMLVQLLATWWSCKGFQASLNKPTQTFN